MPVLLDDTPLTTDGARLRDAVAAAVNALQPDGRVLVEIQLDGQTLPEDEIEARADEPVDDAEVRLYSADPTALATSTLEQVRSRLAEADQMMRDAADLLQGDQTAAGLRKVAEAIEPWLQTQQAVIQCATLIGIDLNGLDIDGQPLTAPVQDLLQQLTTLKELITANDTVALADALAYEWPETTARWDRLVATLIERIEDDQA